MKSFTHFRQSRVAALLAGSLVLLAPLSLAAQDAAPATEEAAPADPATTVVARLNGEDITEADLQLAAQDLRETLMQIPAEQRLTVLLNGIIEMRLMAQAAEAAKLTDDVEVNRRVEFMHDRALQAEYLKANVIDAITDESVQALYDAEVAAFVPEEQVRASHILVDSEEAAKAIIAELDGGADFATIAKERSLDLGSGANGGDLDFFVKSRMVPPFADAAFALDVGSYTKTPVQSEFGWHVILVTDKRMSSPPTFEERRTALREQVARQLFTAQVEKLRDAAEIEVLLPTTETPAEGAPAEAAPEATPE